MSDNNYQHHFHVYECDSCIVTFAVEMAFEDQSVVVCPICKCDDHVNDVSSGVMVIEKRKGSCCEQEPIIQNK